MASFRVGVRGSLQQPLLLQLPLAMAEAHLAAPLADSEDMPKASRLLGRELQGNQSAGVFNVRRVHT